MIAWLVSVVWASGAASGVGGMVTLDRPDIDLPPPAFDVATGRPIVNGTISSLSDFPEVVLLGALYPNGGFVSWCSGTLVHPEWVVTAAHCIEDVGTGTSDDPTAGFQATPHIFWGTGQNFQFTEYIAWESMVEHPSYNRSTQSADIALVKLSRPKTSAWIMPVNDSAMTSAWGGIDLTFVGYGITGDDRSDSGIQRYATLPIWRVLAPDIVESYDGTFFNNGYPRMDGTYNICGGDSGGAALIEDGGNWFLAGVNSYGWGGCGTTGYSNAGVNGVVRVDYHIPWMLGYVPELQYGASNGPVETIAELPDLTGFRADDAPAAMDRGRTSPQKEHSTCSTVSPGALGAFALLPLLGIRRRP